MKHEWTRRQFLGFGALFAGGAALGRAIPAGAEAIEWKKKLTPEQYDILREEGTERAFSSSLTDEHRAGVFHCVGCDQPLFSSKAKFDSGTGWPSFYEALSGAVAEKTDHKLILPRTEYHCSRCGGHHGHVFDDGPKPTGLRYCNNGAVLRFAPGEA